VPLDRAGYAALYGPSVGDRVRLGDTDLLVCVEADDAAPGDEPLIGFGKTVRSGQLMATRLSPDEAPDVVITNVLLLDPVLGIRKTSIGIRHGRVCAVGRAGNPETMDDIDVPIGPSTGIVPAEGLIATPGVVDSHVHLSSPNLVSAALAGGVTTVVAMGYGGAWDIGIGPADNLGRLLDAWQAVPLNLVPLARASTPDRDRLEEALAIGAGGFKVHEDTGASPEIIDAAISVAERVDVQVAMHLDGTGETATLRESLGAIAGRTAHLYHVEGCGGGPINLIEAVSEPNVLPSSTNPTVPFGATAVDEHVEMIRTVHRLNPVLQNDMAAARDRVRGWTMAAESLLHDLGAIPIMSSDAMGMGRVGETLRRTFQLAHLMKGADGGGDGHDNARVLRYLAKATINPARTHGIAHDTGSLEVGKLADIVLWHPAFFAAKPQLVLKRGFAVFAPQGSGSASTRLAEPLIGCRQFGAMGAAPRHLAVVYAAGVGQEALASAWPGLRGVVSSCRTIDRSDMLHNTTTPSVRVDARRERVSVDGVDVEPAPARHVPLNRAYFLA